MTDLSPAARAVWEAFNSKFDWVEDGVPGPQFRSIAAALRAAAESVRDAYVNDVDFHSADQWLDAIATELEGAQ